MHSEQRKECLESLVMTLRLSQLTDRPSNPTLKPDSRARVDMPGWHEHTPSEGNCISVVQLYTINSDGFEAAAIFPKLLMVCPREQERYWVPLHTTPKAKVDAKPAHQCPLASPLDHDPTRKTVVRHSVDAKESAWTKAPYSGRGPIDKSGLVVSELVYLLGWSGPCDSWPFSQL